MTQQALRGSFPRARDTAIPAAVEKEFEAWLERLAKPSHGCFDVTTEGAKKAWALTTRN
jgi:hypothetical protein